MFSNPTEPGALGIKGVVQEGADDGIEAIVAGAKSLKRKVSSFAADQYVREQQDYPGVLRASYGKSA